MNNAAENTLGTRTSDLLEASTTLGLLSEIGSNSHGLTQRSLATRLGVALGFTNALIKRCIRKGLIKVADAPTRRYAYYLTPRGFAEKSRLTADYVSTSLSLFRRAREEYDCLLQQCLERNCHHIVLFGAGDLAEIAVLAAQETNAPLVAVVAPELNRETLCGLPVHTDINALLDADCVILTDSTRSQESFALLTTMMPAERILAPPLLNIIRKGGP